MNNIATKLVMPIICLVAGLNSESSQYDNHTPTEKNQLAKFNT